MAGRFAEGIRANEYDSKVVRLSVDCLTGLWLDRIVPACALSPMNCRRHRDNSRELPMQGGGSRRMYVFSMMMALENTDSVCRGMHDRYVIGKCIRRNGYGDVCMHALFMFTSRRNSEVVNMFTSMLGLMADTLGTG